MKYLFLIGICFLGLTSCLSTKVEKVYYHNYSTEDYIKVYIYENLDLGNEILYWRVIYKSDSNIIITETYDSNFEMFNYFEEVINEGGASLIKFIDFEKDSVTGIVIPYHATIFQDDVYRWKPKGEYSYKVDLFRGISRSVSKKREVAGKEKIEWNNSSYKAIKVDSEYIMEFDNSNWIYESQKTSYYVKNIGIVKMNHVDPFGKTSTILLKDIISDYDFKNLKEKTKE